MSGGTQQQTTTQHFEPPSWVTDTPHNWQDFVNRGGQIADIYGTDPSLIYGNSPNQPMVAQMSQLQNQAANGYNAQASAVPWALQQQTNVNANDLLNGYMYNGGQNLAAGETNPYQGDNPYLQGVLDSSNRDITRQFQQGTAAQTDAAAARGGAFGGSAYNQLTAQNAKQLADSIAQNEANVRMGNYNQSAQLAENALNRQYQAGENQLSRGMQALQLNNQTNAQQNQSLAGLMGAGDLQQQTQQNNINAAMNLFNANVNQPVNAENMYGSWLQQASGLGGTNSSTVTLPRQSGLMQGLGAGIGGLGLLSMLGVL